MANSFYEETDDGFGWGVRQLNGIKVDPYIATITFPKPDRFGLNSDGGRFNHYISAKRWCRRRIDEVRRDYREETTSDQSILDIRSFDKFTNHGGASDAARKHRSENDDQE